MSGSQCPICLDVTNRLVKEACGHSKCRNCFIQEVNGCQECSKDRVNLEGKIYADTGEESQVDQCWHEEDIRIIHSNEIPNVAILEDITIKPESKPNLKSDKKDNTPATKKTIPSHVVQLKTPEGVSYKCTVCNKVFRSRSQQYYHLYCNEVLKKPFLCKICSKHFSSLNHFKYHQETHKDNQSYECGICSKIFTREVTLRKHLRNHDRNSRYSCNQCNATFKDKVAYRAHCDKHKDIYPFSCEHCDKRFCLKSTFKQHQLVHSDIASFKCTECNKRFKRNSSYKAHLVQHSESQSEQYTCRTCEKKFSSSKAFHRHKNVHDGSSFFKCTFCAVKCKRRDNLARHVKNMHPKEKTPAINELVIMQDNNTLIEQEVQQTEQNETLINVSVATKDIITHETVDPIQSHDSEISQKCSVIKSIGNVRPVVVPQNSDTNKIDTTDPQMDANKNTAAVPLLKKPKKKYDPREIYRKILLASNEEDSLIDEADANTASEYTNLEDEVKTKELFKSTTQLNFAEIHWRKRTSQYFSSINAS